MTMTEQMTTYDILTGNGEKFWVSGECSFDFDGFIFDRSVRL